MSLHRLPDGRVIEIKDNLGDQELIALQNHLAELYPGYYTPYIEEVERTYLHAIKIFRKYSMKLLSM